ncbi:hypothetical protein [Halorubrum sp. Eb13]|nr:hypothetical protein [Halorubrum sp. Eb13]
MTTDDRPEPIDRTDPRTDPRTGTTDAGQAGARDRTAATGECGGSGGA